MNLAELEAYIEDLEIRERETKRLVVNCFGIFPVCCNGQILVDRDHYNELSEHLNK